MDGNYHDVWLISTNYRAANYRATNYKVPLRKTTCVVWCEMPGCLIFIGLSPQKRPTISGSFAEKDVIHDVWHSCDIWMSSVSTRIFFTRRMHMCWWCTPWHGWLSDDTWMPHVINDVSFRKRASNCRSLLWRETNTDKHGATLHGLQMTHEWHTWSMTSLSAKEPLIVGLFCGERLIKTSTARHWMACRWHMNDIRDQWRLFPQKRL